MANKKLTDSSIATVANLDGTELMYVVQNSVSRKAVVSTVRGNRTFDTAAAVQAANIPSSTNSITTVGYTVAGDGGGATYIRSASQPQHQFYLTSADGSYWEYMPGPEGINAKAAGMVGDFVTDNYTTWLKVQSFLKQYGRTIKQTCTIAAGGITLANHGFRVNEAVVFSTTGALPGLTAGTVYFVILDGLTVNTFKVAATNAYPDSGCGAAIDTSGSQSGIHSVQACAVDWQRVIIPPGNYFFSNNISVGANQQRLHVIGNGAAVNRLQQSVNVFSIGQNYSFSPTRYPWVPLSSVAINSPSITMQNATYSAIMPVGTWIVISALDLQNTFNFQASYPPNVQYFEFNRVTGISGTTVNLAFRTRHNYKTTYPQFWAGDPATGNAVGPAYAYPLNSDWNTERVIEGMRFLAGYGQLGVNARRTVLRNCVVESGDSSGLVPSIGREIIFENCEVLDYLGPENDKLVEFLKFEGSTLTRMDFQGTSIERVLIENCKIDLLGGQGKNTVIANSDIGQLLIGVQGGIQETLTANNSRFLFIGPNSLNYDVGGGKQWYNCIQNWSFANGILKWPMATFEGNGWVVPGAKVQVNDMAGAYNSMGSPFTIVDVFSDGTNFCADTDLVARPVGIGTNASAVISIGSPAQITWTSHGLSANTPVIFQTSGALPTGLTDSRPSPEFAWSLWYVSAAGLATDTFQVSATAGGTSVNTSGSQSGTHTAYSNPLHFQVVRCPSLAFENCFGCAQAVELSNPNAHGKPLGSYSNRRYTRNIDSIDTNLIGTLCNGNVEQVTINVIKAYSGSTTTFNAATLNATAFDANLARSDLSLVINPTIAGKRVITTSTVSGAQSGDTLASTSVWLSQQYHLTYNVNMANEDLSKLPIIDIEIITNQGTNELEVYTPRNTVDNEVPTYVSRTENKSQ